MDSTVHPDPLFSRRRASGCLQARLSKFQKKFIAQNPRFVIDSQHCAQLEAGSIDSATKVARKPAAMTQTATQNGRLRSVVLMDRAPTLVSKPPRGPNWVHEIKWDGYV